MRKLPNMVIIEETIGDGFINENGKKVVVTKTKTYARSKDWYEKNKGDETLKVLGDAYEKITTYQGRKIRQIVTLPKEEKIIEKEKVEKPDLQKAKPGPKKKEEKLEENPEQKEN